MSWPDKDSIWEPISSTGYVIFVMVPIIAYEVTADFLHMIKRELSK